MNVTTSVAAERLNVPLSTLKAWLDRLDLPLPVDSRGRRMLDQDALNWLQTVRSLRESDLGYDTIRRRLADDGVPVRAHAGATTAPVEVLDAVRHAFQEVLAEQHHLGTAYGEAVREQGRLEARVAQLERALAERETEVDRLVAALRANTPAHPQPIDIQSTGRDPITGEPTKPGWKFW